MNDLLKDKLISYPESSSLDKSISLAIRIDNGCREHWRDRDPAGGYERFRAPRSFDSVSSTPSNPAPVFSGRLTNAPAVFQCLVNDFLRNMLGHFVYVYLDDILIFSKDPTEHVQHVRQVLQRLLENWLNVKAEKCEFHAATVSFLGYVVTHGQVKMDTTKV